MSGIIEKQKVYIYNTLTFTDILFYPQRTEFKQRLVDFQILILILHRCDGAKRAEGRGICGAGTGSHVRDDPG